MNETSPIITALKSQYSRLTYDNTEHIKAPFVMSWSFWFGSMECQVNEIIVFFLDEKAN